MGPQSLSAQLCYIRHSTMDSPIDINVKVKNSGTEP